MYSHWYQNSITTFLKISQKQTDDKILAYVTTQNCWNQINNLLSVMFFLDILLIKLFQHLHEIPVKRIGEPRMLRGIQKVMYTYNEWNPDILKCLLLKCHCYLHDSKKRPPVWTSTAIFVNFNVNVYMLTVLI